LTTGGFMAFVGGTLVKESLATIGLLAFIGSTFVKKALSGASSRLVGGLLVFMGGTLVKKALAGCRLEEVVRVLPQFVDRPLPILVGALHGRKPQEEWAPQAIFGGSRLVACWSSRSACWSHSLSQRGQPTSAGGLNF
jgi:hypothetical protein